MFKDFERIAKESKQQPTGASASAGAAEDPFAKLLAGMSAGGEGGEGGDDKQMMDMFKGLMGSLGEGG